MTNKLLPVIVVIILQLTACSQKLQTTLCEILPENVYSDGEFEFSEWSGYRWFVIPLI